MSGIDTARWAEALSRPGIDPRTWTTLAVITAVNVTEYGVMVDITTIAGLEETAAVSPIYAGPGFGLYAPLKNGDFVVVAFPEGVSNTGARVIGRTWDEGDAPPSSITDHPDDFILVIEPDKNLRMVVSGSGDAMISATGTGKVRLGNDGATEAPLRGNTYRDAEDNLLTWLQQMLTALQTVMALPTFIALGGSATPANPVIILSGTIGAMLAAITAFKAAAPTYLAQKVAVY